MSSDHDNGVASATSEEILRACHDRIEELGKQMEIETFGIKRFMLDDDRIRFYTGFDNYRTLICCFEPLQPAASTYIIGMQPEKS